MAVGKPDPAPYRRGAAALGVPAGTCVAIVVDRLGRPVRFAPARPVAVQALVDHVEEADDRAREVAEFGRGGRSSSRARAKWARSTPLGNSKAPSSSITS